MSRKRELDHMNAIACLLVILIHVLSIGISSAEHDSWQAAILYFPWRLSAFVVPMFLYTGAIKLAGQFGHRQVGWKEYVHYLLQRLKKIYLPYVLWVILYYAAFYCIGYVRGEWKEFFSYLLAGNLASPFYYIVIVMQFYALMPLWVWMLRRVPAWLGLCAALLVTMCMHQFPQLLERLEIGFPYTDRLFAVYLIFWVLGLYVGQEYERMEANLRQRGGLLLGAVLLVLCAGLSYLGYARGIWIFDLNDVKLAADLMSILLLHALCLQRGEQPGWPRHTLDRIYESSFFVYLSHCLFLTLFTSCLQMHGITRLFPLLAARAVVCYTVPFGLYWLYRKLGTAWKPLRGLLG